MLLSGSVYLAVYSSPRNAYTPVVVFLFSMTVMVVNHFYVQWDADRVSAMDHTAPMMIIVMKITSFSWSVLDANRLESLTEAQRKAAITKFPSLVEFMGFINFFPCFLIGPNFSFMDYRNFIEQVGDFKEIPHTLAPAINCVSSAIIPAIVSFRLSPLFSFDRLRDKGFVADKPLLYIFGYLQISAITARCMYYMGWKIAEAACVYAGLGFNGRDNHGAFVWNRTENCNVLAIEFAENTRSFLAEWNKNTSAWLKDYVYLRLINNGVSPSLSTAATSITSAVWHGVCFGYYLSFLFLAFTTTIARHMRRNVRPWFASQNSRLHSLKRLYDMMGTLATQVSLSYVMIAFQAKTYTRCLESYAPFDFIGHIFILVLLTGFEFGPFGVICRKIGQSIGAEYNRERTDAKKEN